VSVLQRHIKVRRRPQSSPRTAAVKGLGGFLGTLTASVLAGLIVLWLGYLFVERKLRLTDRAHRAADAQEQRRVNREAVLSIVHAELESNADQLTNLEQLPHEDQRLLYPLFDVSMWPLVTDAPIFTALDRETAEALMRSYNRMNTANEQNAFLNDMHQGRTSITVTMAAAGSMDKELVEETYEKYLGYRDYIRTALIERLQELKPHLDAAIDAVEAELGMTFKHRAAERTYRPDAPPKYAGEGPPRVPRRRAGRGARLPRDAHRRPRRSPSPRQGRDVLAPRAPRTHSSTTPQR
jgi:hypothetical protein